MREALHIFRKDTRRLRVAIGVVLGWTAIFALAWSAVDLSYTARFPSTIGNAAYVLGHLADFVFPALWAYIVSQVVHAEALPGDRQFWLTRPYHRGSLVAAKVLFVLAYLSCPLLLAQLVILLAQGFPLHAVVAGLLWTQVVMIGAVALPAAALASLTTTLPQFVLWAIFAPVCAVVIASLRSWGSFDWVRVAGVGLEIAALSAAVVALQYARRRTRTARLVGLTGVLAALMVAPLLPWSYGFAVQQRVGRDADLAVTARIERPPVRTLLRLEPAPLHVWVALDGIPEDARFRCEGYRISIVGASPNGRQWTSALTHYAGAGTRSDGGCPVSVLVPEDVRAAFGETPVTVRATVYVTVFGPPETNTVARQSARWIPSVGLCWSHATTTTRVAAGRVETTPATDLICLTPFRRPSSIVQVSGADAGIRTPGTRPSYSPFPAGFDFTPEPVLRELFFDQTDITLRTREPIAHLRRTAEITNVHVPDFDVRVEPGATRQ